MLGKGAEVACRYGKGKQPEAQEETQKKAARGLTFYESRILYILKRIESTEASLVILMLAMIICCTDVMDRMWFN